MDVEKMISGDTLEFSLRTRITERASHLRQQLDDSLALNIVNRLAESLERGRRGGAA